MTEYNLILSTTEPNNEVGLLKFRQGDIKSQILNVTITENGKLFKFDGLSVFFNAVLPNGTVVRDKVQTVDYDNSKITYQIIDSFLQEVSTISAWFSFENGTKVVVDSTKNFRYLVVSGWQSCIIQGNYIYELSEIQREIEEIIGNKDFSTVINKIDYLETGIAFLDNTKTSKDEFEAKTSLLDNIKISKDEFEAKTSVQDSKIQTLMSNGPKGVYATLSNLVTALPSGDTGIYITSDDGHWRYWNGSWVDGGIYQSNMPSPNGSVAFVYGNTTEGMIWDLTEKTLYWTDDQFINYQTTGCAIPPDTLAITSPQFIVFDTVDKKIKAVGDSYLDGISNTRILLCYLNPYHLEVCFNAAIGRLIVDDGVNKRDLNELINYSTKIPKYKFTAIVYGASIIGEMNWDRSNEKLSWSNCYVMIGNRAWSVSSGEVAVTNERVVVFDTNLETFVNIGQHYLLMNENQAFVCSLLTNLEQIVTCSISKFSIDDTPYINGLAIPSVSGRRYACFGDSITSDQVSGIGTLVANYLNLSIVGNFATGYATCSDWHSDSINTTTVTLSEPQNTNTNDNVLSNQVRRMLQHTTETDQQIIWSHPKDGEFSLSTELGVGLGHVTDLPDIIYIAVGTNDGNNTENAVMDDTDIVFSQSYSQLTRNSIASSLRWAVETLRSAYPKAKILVASPLQTDSEFSWMSFSEEKKKRDIIDKVCQFCAVHFIDSFSKSGFSSMMANILSVDGIHPNEEGKNLIKNYVANEIENISKIR
jgi:Lysophospholipase L1 and related esterases